MFNKNKGEKLSKTDKYLAKRNLSNLETDIDVQVRNVMSDLAGNGFLKAGMALSFAKAPDQAKVTYLSALTEQNWILVKQNDELIKQQKINMQQNNELIKQNNAIINLLKENQIIMHNSK